MYKIIVAGSRTIANLHIDREDDFNTQNSILLKYEQEKLWITDILDSYLGTIEEIVCGLAQGPDWQGKLWAEANNIYVKEFPADWTKYGKRAGFLRNEEMAQYSDVLIAFWDGTSKGTNHMINTALDCELDVHVYQTPR